MLNSIFFQKAALYNHKTFEPASVTCLNCSHPFFSQGRLQLSGATVTKHLDDAESGHYAFEIGGMFQLIRMWGFCFVLYNSCGQL